MPSEKIQQRVSKTKRRVLQVSADFFVDQGYEHVTVEDIIAEADIARSSFYRFFSNKEDLLAQILCPLFERGCELLDDIDSDQPRALMSGLINVYAQLWEEHQQAMILSGRIGKQFMHLVADSHNRYASKLEILIQSIESSNILRNDNAHQSTLLIARSAVTIMQVYANDPDYRRKFVDTMEGMLLKG